MHISESYMLQQEVSIFIKACYDSIKKKLGWIAIFLLTFKTKQKDDNTFREIAMSLNESLLS